MEGGIEHGHHGGVLAEDFLAGLHSDGLRGIVEGAQILEGHDIVDDGIGDNSGDLVLLAAVEHAVADGGDLAHAVDDLALAGAHHLHQLHKGFLMGGEGHIILHLHAIGGLVADPAVHADALAQALGQNMFVGHIHQLILQRGAARIDNQYFHLLHSL